VSVAPCIALLKAEVERKLPPTAQNLMPSGPPGRHDPAEDPAAAEETPNAQPTTKPSLNMLSAKKSRGNSSGFRS
jgi:hypothetical protein